ncbi:DUF3891 family protein [Halalkalibacter nanhaiisediminis]|uniref:Uncharacterized protein DUF3891 n=1 Tax=Halalkalibacter nanhaiisediminis TaxID=688079 RepID=A0A562QBM9_9BACI|nr:DUF3891 family protein [Halalkalibacter nanhaiisediminis]TWI53590.1 uncharacterized protein DUF3891 [Halalkalibacter nanhaiisediminis]
MIIRERKNEFIMIKQYDHACLAGKIAAQVNENIFKSTDHLDEVIKAASEHDRGWVGLDETPIWNDEENIPYSFQDYPLELKLAFYKKGIDEIETVSPYAALLCSFHFSSFFPNPNDTSSIQFVNEESKRQKRIKRQVKVEPDLLQKHFRWLQFCDDLSLYVCLNEPGVTKENEHPWFIDGFRNTEIFGISEKPIVAEWLSDQKINVQCFPFEKEFTARLTYKAISKNDIDENGVDKGFDKSPWLEQEITFVGLHS